MGVDAHVSRYVHFTTVLAGTTATRFFSLRERTRFDQSALYFGEPCLIENSKRENSAIVI